MTSVTMSGSRTGAMAVEVGERAEAAEVRYCEDCRWCRRERFLWWHPGPRRCSHPAVDPDNRVTRQFPGARPCEAYRGEGGICGPEGKLWEPREET